MNQTRLTPLMERRAFERVVTPVIIRTESGRLQDIATEIAPLLEDLKERFPRLAVPEIPALGMFPLKIFPRFSMIGTLLPREVIFRLAENRYIERIFPDEPMFAFQYPTVEEDGVFTSPHKITEEITFTTTFYTRRLLGANIANGQGFWGRNVLVSVLDTGGSRIHEQTRRMSFETSMKGQYTDANGHGQWCLSCVGGVDGVDEYLSQRSGRRVRCLGISPECDLLSVKCLGYIIGMGMTSNIIDAMNTSIERGCDIISMSLGGPSQTEKPEDDPFYSVLDEALKYNIIPIIAAGNSGPSPSTIGSPGCLSQSLTVGAYDPVTGEIAGFSSRGPTNWDDIKPDCIAPGVNIDSGCVGVCDRAGDGVQSRYSPISGTSMATPHIAGLVALMSESMNRRINKTLTVDEIKSMLSKLGHEKSNEDGWGILDWSMWGD